ncbi:18722_t:CDS:1, partial [Gigaspora rosea]
LQRERREQARRRNKEEVQKCPTAETTTYSADNPYVGNRSHEIQESCNQQVHDNLGSDEDLSMIEVTPSSQAPVEGNEEVAPETGDHIKVVETTSVEMQVKDTTTLHTQPDSMAETSINSMDEDPKDGTVHTQKTTDDGFTLVTGRKKDSRKGKSPAVVTKDK